MSGVDQHAEAHRLKNELGYGARRIAAELGITRHAATLLLGQPLAHQVAESAEPVAEVAAGGGRPVAVVAASDGQERRPVAEMRLPQRVAQPLAGMDVSQWRALRRDLAVLAQCGSSAESLVHQAVVAMAYAYRQALARGDIKPQVPFLVSEVRLTPLVHRAAQTTPAPAAAEGV